MKTVDVRVKLTEEEHRAVKAQAALSGETLKGFVADLIRKEITKPQDNAPGNGT